MSYQWLFYILVQAVVIAVCAWLAVELASTASIIPAVIGIWFAWRSLNHPDFMFRRLAGTSLFAAIGTLALTGLARIQLTGSSPDGGWFHAVLLAVRDGGDTATALFVAAAVLFALVDLGRMLIQGKPGAKDNELGSIADGHQLTAVRSGDSVFRVRVTFEVVNRSQQALAVHEATVVQQGLFPAKIAADLVGPSENLEVPKPDEGFTVAPGAKRVLAIAYERKAAIRGFVLRRLPRLIGIFDMLTQGVVVNVRSTPPLARPRFSLEMSPPQED